MLEEAKRRGLTLQPAGYKPGPPYAEWLATNFPHVASKPLAPHHHRFWRWISGLQPGVYSPPHVAIWARGGGKSTTLELGVGYVGTTLARRFVLVVCESQEQANARIGAIRTLLERIGESPAVTGRGTVKGWRMDQIRTSRGFSVAGIGLDAAMRGIKLDEFRPDWIVLDDLDGLHDTATTTLKKELTLTASVLGSGSDECVVSLTQNLIIEDGIAARIAGRKSDYLADADVDGPIPAVLGLQTEITDLPNGERAYRIAGGVPTWEGKDLAACERDLRKIGLASFLREMQHEVRGAQGWVIDAERIVVGEPESPAIQSVFTMDLAATENGGDFTVFGHFLGLANRRTWVYELERMQKEAFGVRTAMVAFGMRCLISHPKTLACVLEDPSQAGKFQFLQLCEDLIAAGFPRDQTRKVKPRKEKAVRARGFAEEVNAGRVGMRERPWNTAYRTILNSFREDDSHLYDDDVDVSSDADTQLWREPGKQENHEPQNPLLSLIADRTPQPSRNRR